MLAVIKVFLSLLSIMHSMFDLIDQPFHFFSKNMSMGVDGGFFLQ